MSNRSPWLLLACLMTAGCNSMTQRPQVPFPRPSQQLLAKCERPQPLPKREKISAAEALPTVSANYARHHGCANRSDALQEWVREQYQTTNGEPLGY